MNKRIRELINESTCFKEGDTEGKYDIEVFDKEKFAELIVRECIDIADEYDGAGSIIVSRIEKHFGVEE